MKIEFTIDTPEKIDVVIEKDWLTGGFTCTANGQVHALRTPAERGGRGLTLREVHIVEVGTTEKRTITIEHRGPMLFATLRPHEYVVTVDGKVVAEYHGQ